MVSGRVSLVVPVTGTMALAIGHVAFLVRGCWSRLGIAGRGLVRRLSRLVRSLCSRVRRCRGRRRVRGLLLVNVVLGHVKIFHDVVVRRCVDVSAGHQQTGAREERA